MATFTVDTISGKAFDKDEYSVDDMMLLDAKLARHLMYFLSIEKGQIRQNNKWVSAAIYISATYRYVRYRIIKSQEEAPGPSNMYYQYPAEEFTTLDFSKKKFDVETQASSRVLKVGELEILCPKSKDFNVAVFGMQVSDRFYENGKAAWTRRSLDGLRPYTVNDHGKRLGIQLDENKLVTFPLTTLSFIVHDEFGGELEKGILQRAEVKLQRWVNKDRVLLSNVSGLRSNPNGCEIVLQTSAIGVVTDYTYQCMERSFLEHAIYFYLDKKAVLYGNPDKKTLFYEAAAYGVKGIEMHFVNEADYYTMGNFLNMVINALGGEGQKAAVAGGKAAGASIGDVESSTKKQEPEVSPMEELNNLVGLEVLKNDVQEMFALMRMQKLREKKGMKAVPVNMHLVFTGNPGTGKTTVARILGRLYKEIGVLPKGQLVECDRSGLVAGYIGHTAIQTQKKIEEAIGGILFVDEAYTLAKEGNDFGQEAIDTLLKAMEDRRGEFVVIVAGYPDLMEKFINSNPGLKSRFNKYLHFPDYSAEELLKIFYSNCKKYEYKLDEEAAVRVKERIELMVIEKDENFANARQVRNLFETIITNQAFRIDKIGEPTDEQLVTITASDVDAD